MVLREAVTNVIRHSQARSVEVELRVEGGAVLMSICDDGRGGIGQHGNGLVGMHERARAIGAMLEVDSGLGAGTRLVLSLPHETAP